MENRTIVAKGHRLGSSRQDQYDGTTI